MFHLTIAYELRKNYANDLAIQTRIGLQDELLAFPETRGFVYPGCLHRNALSLCETYEAVNPPS